MLTQTGKTVTKPDKPMRASPQKETGIGLRSAHYQDILAQKPATGWLEVHPENYFGGGAHRYYLLQARELYPLSLHAVGLSMGSDQPVCQHHMAQIKELIDIYEPFQVSDHASWSKSGNAHLNDLLPLPYTYEALNRLTENIDRVQNYFDRRILIENPSSYISYKIDEMTEYDFMNTLSEKAGCGILLDINNIYVQSVNHDFDAYEYINHIKADKVGELHLAGHTKRIFGLEHLLIDTHNTPVCSEVWALYTYAIRKLGAIPTLIEWDTDLPELDVLIEEANKAQDIINANRHTTHEAT